MPSRAASTSSVAEPVHWIGRECGVSPSSAPSVTIISQPVVRATPITSSQNDAPAQVRLDAEQQHEVAAAAGQRAGRERERRPVDRRARRRRRARPSDARPGSRGTPRCRARRTAGRSTRADEPAHRVGGRVGRVVPTRERGDHRGPAQRRLDAPADGHPVTLGPAPPAQLSRRTTGLRQRADALDRDLDDVAVDAASGAACAPRRRPPACR